MKPIIGITANYSFDGSSEFAEGIGAKEQEWQLLADDYIASFGRAAFLLSSRWYGGRSGKQ